MPTLVPPDGRLDSPVAFVGSRPGSDDCISRRNFTGPSGKLLWALSKIPRSDAYVTNVRKDFSAAHATPTRAEIDEALPSLRDELARTSANIIVCLGGDALFALTGKTSLDHWRGSILESTLLPGRKCIATWNPATALQTYSLRYIIDLDLRKALRESKYPDIRRPQREFLINRPCEETIELLRGLADVVSADIETFDDQVSCLSIADSGSRAIGIPFVGGRYTVSELAAIWRELDTVMRTREFNGQNFQFDTTRLERLGFRIPKFRTDTMLAHHLLWTELGSGVKRKQGDRGVDSLTGKHSLAFITSCYTDEPYYKHESETAWTDPGLSLEERFLRYWTYNCKDSCVTHESAEKLEAELHRHGLWDYFQKHVMGLVRPVMAMQEHGLRVDRAAVERTRTRLQLEADVLQSRLNNRVGFECNVKSAPHMRHLIFDVLKMRNYKLTRGGQPSTDEDTIRALAYNSPHEDIFKLILDIRERRTNISGFLNLEVEEDGKYRASYLIHGTDSGRLASRSKRKGPQLQNIPKPTRNIFIPDDEYVFVEGDYPRAEAKYVAYDSEAVGLIELFEDSSRDLYSEVAAESLGRRVDSIGKESIERQCFKQVVLGSNYLMGPFRLIGVLRKQEIDIMNLPVPGNSGKAKATYVKDAYLNRYPEIKRWQKRIWEEGSRSRVLRDSYGRRRVFLGRMDDHTHGVMCSYRPQATIGGSTNLAMIRLHAKGYTTAAQVHDSILLHVKKSQRDQAVHDLKKAMHTELVIHGRTMILDPEIKWSDTSWGKLRDWRPGQWN